MHRVSYDSNEMIDHDRAGLWLPASIEDLAEIGDELVAGLRVTIYMSDELEAEATLLYDAGTKAWTARIVPGAWVYPSDESDRDGPARAAAPRRDDPGRADDKRVGRDMAAEIGRLRTSHEVLVFAVVSDPARRECLDDAMKRLGAASIGPGCWSLPRDPARVAEAIAASLDDLGRDECVYVTAAPGDQPRLTFVAEPIAGEGIVVAGGAIGG